MNSFIKRLMSETAQTEAPAWIFQEWSLTAGLTGSAGQTDSGKLKLPRRTEGCHRDVWEGERVQSTIIHDARMAPSSGRSSSEALNFYCTCTEQKACCNTERQHVYLFI